MSQAMNDSPTAPKRKRTRAARACERCRSKKYRCSETEPCSQCEKAKAHCEYDDADHVRRRIAASQSLPSRQDPQGHRTPGTQALETFAMASQYHAQASHQKQDHQPRRSSDESGDGANGDSDDGINELNPHTNTTEFHGPTSSLAFLESARHFEASRREVGGRDINEGTSLVSALHNNAFSPTARPFTQEEAQLLAADRFHFRQSQLFIDAYFQSLHFIHPIIDKDAFMLRCEKLWFGYDPWSSATFIALYYGVMSLGAIVREWEENSIEGLSRFEWSRILFSKANIAVGGLRSSNDLEVVQALIMMAKVCQNELNPNLTYMYLGMAVRASLSAGLNRRGVAHGDSSIYAARTWWGLYSLEIEMSFSLGRPDSLGLDPYHNQTIPDTMESEFDIIPAMITFAQLIRKVSLRIYMSHESLQSRLDSTWDILREMETWIDGLPSRLRFQLMDNFYHATNARDPKWLKRQKLVLHIRYHNVRMVLFRPYLILAARRRSRQQHRLNEAISQCVKSAKWTINMMESMFTAESFFRSWYYNTTYILYAAAIILCYLRHVAPSTEHGELSVLLNATTAVLEAMGDNVVAAKAAELVREATTKVLAAVASEAENTGPPPASLATHSLRGSLAEPSPSVDFSDTSEIMQSAFMNNTFIMDDPHMFFWPTDDFQTIS